MVFNEFSEYAHFLGRLQFEVEPVFVAVPQLEQVVVQTFLVDSNDFGRIFETHAAICVVALTLFVEPTPLFYRLNYFLN